VRSAQFIEVAPEFVTAVEAALGANLQAIVMKDTMVAESVIKTLSAQKLGKAALALRELDGISSISAASNFRCRKVRLIG
jgi:chromosome segregation ATPase